MIINDRVYGEFEISEPVLIELINSKSLQRLKNISQMGMPDEYYHRKGFSRYEHSVGVMLLLRKLNASLPEQIAGLLHDVSHTAFSHVIDWVIGDSAKDNYQDDSFMEFIEGSEIPSILKKHGFDYKFICDLDKFTLLENEAPNICADRVDYSLREIIDFEDNENFNKILNGLVNHNGTIVFDNLNSAEIFAFDFARCQREHWAGEEAKARYYILGNVLRKALDLGIIKMPDFLKTDYEVIKLLIDSKDKNVLNGLEMLRKGFIVSNSDSNNGIILRKKFRYVDPFVLKEDSLFLLSDLSGKYKRSLDGQKKEAIEEQYIEVKAK